MPSLDARIATLKNHIKGVEDRIEVLQNKLDVAEREQRNLEGELTKAMIRREKDRAKGGAQ